MLDEVDLQSESLVEELEVRDYEYDGFPDEVVEFLQFDEEFYEDDELLEGRVE